jgi:hypothetical protein
MTMIRQLQQRWHFNPVNANESFSQKRWRFRSRFGHHSTKKGETQGKSFAPTGGAAQGNGYEVEPWGTMSLNTSYIG